MRLPLVILASAVLLPSIAGAARPAAVDRLAAKEVRDGIQQAQVPPVIKARADRALDRALKIAPSAPPNQATAAQSAEGSPFVNVKGTVGTMIRGASVGFRGLAQRSNLPGSFWGSTHGVSWSESTETPTGKITTIRHEVAPTNIGFVEQASVSRAQRTGAGERFEGMSTRYHLLDGQGKRVGEVGKDAASKLVKSFDGR